MHFISSVLGGALLLVPASSSSSPDVVSVNPTGAALDLLASLASQRQQVFDDSLSAGDPSLMLLCGVVLVALQLRRRQKTLRTSRFTL